MDSIVSIIVDLIHKSDLFRRERRKMGVKALIEAYEAYICKRSFNVKIMLNSMQVV